jgi:spermidine/putrescine ABC transporter ATP-binding subunit
MTDASALDIREVTKAYGSVQALGGVSLSVRQGEIMTLLGPSGCGKTTLLYLVAGFASPDQGDIYIFGERVTDRPTNQRDIGVVFQNYALFPHMSVFDNVAFGLKMRKVSGPQIRERVREALDIVKLGNMAERLPRQLSGGQQQRVALARALVIRPKVLLLDEPLSALDKHLRAAMQVELREIQRQIGVTTIFVTHDQGEALSLSDRITVMSGGFIQQISAPIDMYRRPQNGFVASFIGDINALDGRLVHADGGASAVQLAGTLRLDLPPAHAEGLRVGDRVTVFIRPEALEPCALGEGAQIAGTVVNHVYQGSFVDLYCDIDGVGQVHLRTLGQEAISRFPVGQAIALTLDPSEVVVLPGGSS